MLQDALRAEGRALEGYRVLVMQRAFVAAPPLCEALAAQGGEIVGPVSTVVAAVAVVSREPIDVVVSDAAVTDAGPLIAILAAEGVPLVRAAVVSPSDTGLHDLIDRVMTALEG